MKIQIFIATMLFSLFFTVTAQAQAGWTQTNLSAKRIQMGAAALGSKVYFAGGYIGFSATTKVDIYDLKTGQWSAGNLSVARNFPTGISVGSKVMFAGGTNNGSFSTVDIFDTLTNQWTTAALSKPRFSIAAATFGHKVLFAGGADYVQEKVFATVDLYDYSTNTWTVDSLSEARSAMAVAVVGTKAIFAGGYKFNGLVSDRVDIYDFSQGTWQTTTLPLARGFASAATVGGKVLIGGGTTVMNTPTSRVDIYDPATNSWTTSNLSVARAFIDNAASACGKAFFVGGCQVDYQNNEGFHDPTNVVDMYNPETNSWSVEHLSHAAITNAVIANGNYVFSAGGTTDLTNPAADYSTVDIYTCSSSATEDLANEALDFSIGPNPVGERFLVQFSSVRSGSFSLFRTDGAMVFSEKLREEQQREFSVAGLSTGVYYWKWVGEKDGEANSGKILVMR